MVARIERQISLPAPPDAVWEALTDPRRLAEWFGGVLDIWPTPGGDVLFFGPRGEQRRGVVEVADPGQRLAFWWWPEGPDGGPAPGTKVEVRLEPMADGTHMTLVEEEGEPPAAAASPAPVGFVASRPRSRRALQPVGT